MGRSGAPQPQSRGTVHSTSSSTTSSSSLFSSSTTSSSSSFSSSTSSSSFSSSSMAPPAHRPEEVVMGRCFPLAFTVHPVPSTPTTPPPQTPASYPVTKTSRCDVRVESKHRNDVRMENRNDVSMENRTNRNDVRVENKANRNDVRVENKTNGNDVRVENRTNRNDVRVDNRTNMNGIRVEGKANMNDVRVEGKTNRNAEVQIENQALYNQSQRRTERDIHTSSRPPQQGRTERDIHTSSRPPQQTTTTRSHVPVQQNGGVTNTQQATTSNNTCHAPSVNEVMVKNDSRGPPNQARFSDQPGYTGKQQPILRRTFSLGTSHSQVPHNNNNNNNNSSSNNNNNNKNINTNNSKSTNNNTTNTTSTNNNKNTNDGNNNNNHNHSKGTSESLLARIKARVEQLTPGKDEMMSGKEAWEVTQKKKALMREEFFKIPYEECNKEAARSLGGRLNKSEPRLNTICKDRKKRNSLSYKRRVHFDLEDDRDLDDAFEPSRTGKYEHSCLSRKHSAQAYTNVGPPKKVVVSIYSINDPAKRVQLPGGYCDGGHVMDVPAPQMTTQSTPTTTTPTPIPSPPPTTTKEYRTRNGVIIGRPTDLDSLQREVTVSPTATTATTTSEDAPANHLNSNSDSDSSDQEVRLKSSLKSTSPMSNRWSGRINSGSAVMDQRASPTLDLISRRYSLPPPLQQMSVRPRRPSAHFSSTSDKPDASKQSQSQGMVSSSQQQPDTPDLTHHVPVPAPRSHIITSSLKKSHSVQDDFYRSTTPDVSTSSQQHPAPDTRKHLPVSPPNTSSLKKSQSVQNDFYNNTTIDVTASSQHTALQTPQQTTNNDSSSSQVTRNARTNTDSSTHPTSQTRQQQTTGTDPGSPSMHHNYKTPTHDVRITTSSAPQISRPETLNLPTDTKPSTNTPTNKQTSKATPPRATYSECPSSSGSQVSRSSSVSPQLISSKDIITSISGGSSVSTTRPHASVKDGHLTTATLYPSTSTVHPLTPPHTPSPPRTPTTPRIAPHASETYTLTTPLTPPTTSRTPVTPRTLVMSSHAPTTPHALFTTPPTTPHTPAATQHTPTTTPSTPSTPTTPTIGEVVSALNPPIPKPRKRISVSQQTSPPARSPAHAPHSHTPQPSSHTPQSSSPHTPLTSSHPPHPTSLTPHPSSRTTQSSTNRISKPAILTPKPNLTSRPIAPTSVPSTPKIITKPNQSNGHITTTGTKQLHNGTNLPNNNSNYNRVSHKIRNKENQSVRPSQKTDDTDNKGNSVNILMTKGPSYSKHNIILSSHVSSPVPSVTVRKIVVPASSSSNNAPVRCSPSPTPSCASSSCSFGSSGSSSGCFSGSPSPTPTPSPTRIRSSGIPTDL